MEARVFSDVIRVVNNWDHEKSVEIFGKVMGDHFWSKYVGGGTIGKNWYPKIGAMTLLSEMDYNYLQMLIDYVSNKNKQ